jgi:RNA recognition motif-containing protein
VYVGHVPNNARERDLEKFFKGYGSIREVILKNGYGFVVRINCTTLKGAENYEFLSGIRLSTHTGRHNIP